MKRKTLQKAYLENFTKKTITIFFPFKNIFIIEHIICVFYHEHVSNVTFLSNK
jgi:hypothetical protein